MNKRYSYFIKPLQVLTDIIIINLIIWYDGFFTTLLVLYLTVFWVFTSLFLGFYKIYRHSSYLRIVTLLAKQFTLFTLGYFAYFGFLSIEESITNQFLFLVRLFSLVSCLKFLWFFLLKKYRSKGNNNRFVVVVGYDQSAKNLIRLFEKKSNLGYQFLGFFARKQYQNKKYLGNFKSSFDFINTNEVDEVYCSVGSLTKEEIKEMNKFCLSIEVDMKLIPEGNEFYSKTQKIEYYDDSLAVLDIKKLPFNSHENFYLKRIFDIFLSLLVCFFIFPWLIPILWILVKLESKGPLIFKQPREGLNGEHFICYKFRSMKINNLADKIHTTKYDNRVTKIGAFMRKTSIDELPQFFNVLKGDMSVVGPRPHLESLSIEYQKVVEDYLKRHIVKPGITGLAQVSGYRGEIEKNSDIKNRVRLDIFYIENWSFFLDLKIIIKTFFNMFLKEEKAY